MTILTLGPDLLKRAWRKFLRLLGNCGFRHARWAFNYRLINRNCGLADRRFLVVRHNRDPRGFQILIDWTEVSFPQLRPLFELRLLPRQVRDWSPYILHVPWFADPVQAWSQSAYDRALRLSKQCDENQIPVINRVDQLSNAGKSRGAELIRSVGIRTPRHIRIVDEEEFKETVLGLSFPIIVREDWGHCKLTLRADTKRELKDIPLRRFSRPVAVEFIDVQNHDGLFRKYRYVAAGDHGVSLHMHVSEDWFTKGTNCVYTPALRDEEVAFINGPDPNHVRLQLARQVLGLDFIALDYGYDHDGQLVIWEANPYPLLHFSKNRRRYRTPALERALAAMLKLYLSRAGLPIPNKLDDLLPGY